MTPTLTPYRPTVAPGRDGLAQLVRAEWTKFRTVRGWLIATVAAALVMVALGMLVGNGSHETVATPATPTASPGTPSSRPGPTARRSATRSSSSTGRSGATAASPSGSAR